MTVTATISTKDRYFTTLPLTIKGIIEQTVPPDQLIIFDDGEHKDLRGISPYNHLFHLLDLKNIKWRVVFGQRKGQVANHQIALDNAETDLIWRCFRGDTPIETDDGFNTIRNLKVGDIVKTHKGNFKKIIKIYKTRYPHKKPLTWVKTNYSIIKCTPEHPFMIWNNGNIEWITAEKLTSNMFLMYPSQLKEDYIKFDCRAKNCGLQAAVATVEQGLWNHVKNPLYFGDIKVDLDLARFLGLYLAEGCKGNDSIRFIFNNNEQEYIDFISSICRNKFGREPTIHKRWATTVKLNIRSFGKKFIEWFGNDATNKRIPDFVYNWGLQNKLAFILGYLEGDGWRPCKGKVATTLFTTASKLLFYDLNKLLKQCGLNCTDAYEKPDNLDLHRPNSFKSNTAYSGTIYSAAMKKLSCLLHATQINDYLLIPINNVEHKTMPQAYNGDQYVYNLEVEDDNTYIAGPAIVHNCDDDETPTPNCLENLLAAMNDPTIGAVGGLVITPNNVGPRPSFVTNKIEDIYSGFNLQWYRWGGEIEEVDHLYSSFLYRVEAGRKAGGYCKELSPVGHREETMFSHQIKRANYKLLVTPFSLTWHLREDTGGIRSYKDQSLWVHDEEIFKKKLKEWNVIPKEFKYIVLDSGIGDHICFKSILPEFKEKNRGKKIIIACCYNEVFEDVDDITLISIADAKAAFGNLDNWNIYKWCMDRNWDKSLTEAYRRMYL